MALKMEKDVTGAKKNMIDICSSAGQDDPHAADWLTGTWVEEHLTMTVGVIFLVYMVCSLPVSIVLLLDPAGSKYTQVHHTALPFS